MTELIRRLRYCYLILCKLDEAPLGLAKSRARRLLSFKNHNFEEGWKMLVTHKMVEDVNGKGRKTLGGNRKYHTPHYRPTTVSTRRWRRWAGGMWMR